MKVESLAQSTILIVDDKPDNVKVLMGYLKEYGFGIIVARNGEEALKRVAQLKPDIIFLDVMMPGIDGFETCRRLKADEASRDIPVIFMTALSDTANIVKGFEVGGIDYITKPLRHEEVLARMTTHLTLRNLQQELQAEVTKHKKTNSELQARNEELDAFAHTVAHNLKNPLLVLLGYAELLVEDEKVSEKARQFSQIIVRNGHKMNSIIRELLLLAGVRKAKVESKPLDMAKIVTEAQSRLINMIDEHQAQVIYPNEWPVALGYAAWVEEVWANYLSNAIKYGGQPPRLELGAILEENGKVRFWVQDNGLGLTPEKQSQLFTPFTRLNQTNTEGHGLGLSIVQRIIEKLGGEVGIESQVGQGSRFSFTLPTLNQNANPVYIIGQPYKQPVR